MAKKFNEKIYSSFAIDKLTIFAIYNLINQGEQCAFERLVKECFILFPMRFCLRRYKHWPDSNRVYLSMIRCRNNGWIVGNEKSGFKITDFGKKTAKDVFEHLKGSVPIGYRKTTNHKPRERGETIINYIKRSNAFIKFKNNKERFTITDGEFREMLGVTRETPARVLKQNFEYYWNVCKDYCEDELIEFLQACKKILN
jgi:hypothetical protein